MRPLGGQKKHQPHDGKILRCKNTVTKEIVEPYNKSQRCTGRARRALFNPNLHLIIVSNPFLQSMTQIRAGTALKQPPVRITSVINNRMHESRPTRSPVIFTIALYGTRIVHIFVRVCALVQNGILPSIFARHHGHQYLPWSAEIFSHLRLDGPDRSGRMAYGRSKRIDQRQPQRAGGARAGMRGRRGPWPVAGARPGVRCKAIHIAVFGARQFHSSAMSRRM